jgi:hypothetical protein
LTSKEQEREGESSPSKDELEDMDKDLAEHFLEEFEAWVEAMEDEHGSNKKSR